MEPRKLGALSVSPIGMGCMGLSHGYGAIPEHDESVEAIRAAFAAGCTLFDTAESYGPNLAPESRGHNERLVGEALADVRDQVVIATKLYLKPEEVAAQGTYGAIRAHLEASLERLGTGHVDLYYLHRVNREVPVEDVAAAMGRLIDEGLARGWGLSQVGRDTIERAHAVTPLTAVQNIYSMIERGVETDVLPYCMEQGIGVVPFSPIASGLLSGTLSATTDFSQPDDVCKFVPQLRAENIAANQPIVDAVAAVAEKKGATPAQVSLAWMLHKWPNVAPIPGSKRRERILENLGAWDVTLSDEEFSGLERALDELPVHGHRGYIEFDGDGMKAWGKNS